MEEENKENRTLRNKIFYLLEKKKKNIELVEYLGNEREMVLRCRVCGKIFHILPNEFLLSPECSCGKNFPIPDIENFKDYEVVKKDGDTRFFCRHRVCGLVFKVTLGALISFSGDKELCPKCGKNKF